MRQACDSLLTIGKPDMTMSSRMVAPKMALAEVWEGAHTATNLQGHSRGGCVQVALMWQMLRRAEDSQGGKYSHRTASRRAWLQTFRKPVEGLQQHCGKMYPTSKPAASPHAHTAHRLQQRPRLT